MLSQGKELEASTSTAAALLGKMRRVGRVSRKQDLPAWRSAITRNFGIQGNDLSAIAVLDIGSRESIILVSESSACKALHLSVRDKVIASGFKIKEDKLSETALIAEINEAITSNISLKSESSDVRPIIDELINISITKKTSDLHICCREASAMSLQRIHSRLYQHRSFNVETATQLATYMFTHMADSRSRSTSNFSIQKKSMSCMVPHSYSGNQYRLRYKFLRVADGWDVIVRILPMDKGDTPKTFIELGYEPSQVELLEMSVTRSIGLIIITGPTGSGKSTTLKTMMEFDPKRKFKKRYSVEDPVEYKIYGVSQVSVQREEHADGSDDESKDFKGTLLDILRSDPDDVMVGETRDKVVADIVADCVLTGHKIYTTAHTASAMTTPKRLEGLGIGRAIQGDRHFYSALIFQRLLPVLCPNCKVPAASVLSDKKKSLLQNKFGLNLDNIYCCSAEGCEDCNKLGIVDSTVVAEVIVPDSVIRKHIAAGEDDLAELYWRRSRKTAFDDPDMRGKTAFEHGLYKVSQGLIDPLDLELEFEPLELYEIVSVEVE
jgi:type II secretory ATPase GspE/PulE/Tfp pilus assembly ATPase PilB-like protein